MHPMTPPPLAPLPDLLVEPVVRAALAEDLGRAGDITAAACVPAGPAHDRPLRGAQGRRDRGPGLRPAGHRRPGSRRPLRRAIADGRTQCPAGAVLAEVEADARALLSAERWR
jgi:nicotinate-nucleotide pyrophosphorylase (carboxylating)